jgi:hypothetical protein
MPLTAPKRLRRKAFFFEKKKQKTSSCFGFGLSTEAQPGWQNFAASQHRSDCVGGRHGGRSHQSRYRLARREEPHLAGIAKICCLVAVFLNAR